MLIKNELHFLRHQPLVVLITILLSLFALMLGNSASGSLAEKNTLFLTLMTVQMLTLPIAIGALTPIIFLRDVTGNMTEIIQCTPVGQIKRWLIRYASSVLVLGTLSVSNAVLVLLPLATEPAFTSNMITEALVFCVVLTLPTIVFLSALALWLCLRWQSTVVVYLGFAVFGIGYLILASMAGSPVLSGSKIVGENFYQIMLWLDPYAYTAVLDAQDVINVLSTPWFWLNRFMYIGISVLVVFAITYKVRATSLLEHHQEKKTSFISDSKQKSFDLFTATTPFATLVKFSSLNLIKSRTTQLILFVWPLIIFNEVLSGITFAEPLAIIIPNSIDALNLVAFDAVAVMGAFALALWSWQVSSEAKRCQIAELIAATPVTNVTLLATQVVVMSLMVFVLLALTALGAFVAELAAASQVIVTHYFIQLSLVGLPLLLLATVFVCLHHLCRNSMIAGASIVVILLVKFTPITSALGLTHTLWNVADSPLQAPDSFWQFSASASVYLPYMSFWGLFVLAMFLTASDTSHRGTGLGKWSYLLPSKLAYITTILVFFIGAGLHAELVNEKPLTNSVKNESWRANYEKRYLSWQQKAQPDLVHLDADIEFYPQKEYAKLKLSYTLKNNAAEPIAQVLVGRFGQYQPAKVQLENASLVQFDQELQQSVYQFSTPLLPGKQRQMVVEFDYQQPQLWPYRSGPVVKPDFAYIGGGAFLPTIGYQNSYQLQQPSLRTSYGLASHSAKNEPSQYDGRKNHLITQTTVIATDSDHHAVSQGHLVGQWQADNRRYFKFHTNRPVTFDPSWLSVPVSVKSKNIGSTQLNVLAKPNNGSADVSFTAMSDTLTWLAQHMTPYSSEQLTLVAMPDNNEITLAHPQMILVNNTQGFRAKPAKDAKFDTRYRRMIAQTIKQWLDADTALAKITVNPMLFQAVAAFIELAVIEQNAGQEAAQAIVDFETQQLIRQKMDVDVSVGSLFSSVLPEHQHSYALMFMAKLRGLMDDKLIAAALNEILYTPQSVSTVVDATTLMQVLKRHSKAQHQEQISQLLLVGGDKA